MEHKQNEYFSQANKINLPYTDMVSTVPGKVTVKNSAHLKKQTVLFHLGEWGVGVGGNFISCQVKTTRNVTVGWL